MENQHNQLIPPDILAKIEEKILEALTLFKPYMTPLTPQERKSRLRLGDKTHAFVEKAFESAKNNVDFVPSYLPMDEYDVDYRDFHNLYSPLSAAKQLASALSDAKMVAGGEALEKSLIFYRSVQMAAAANIPGAKTLVAELQDRFVGAQSKQQEEPDE